MKQSLSRAVSLVITATMLICMCIGAASAAEPKADSKLCFNDDGSFKILHFCDIQDGVALPQLVKDYISDVVTSEKADLVVLGGDNISGGSNGTKLLGISAIDKYMSVFETLGVPVLAVFGNHDAEGALTKEEMLKIYQKYSCFIGYDADEDLYGVGNANFPIYDAKGESILFNIYTIDSNMYNTDEGFSGYDYVHEDQVEWYKSVREELKAETGAYVPSFAFQHIVVPQIYSALKVTDTNGENTIAKDNKYYTLPEGSTGVLNESPCPPDLSAEKGYMEFEAMKEKGDMLAMFFGHDHVNSYTVAYEGVNLVNTPGTGFGSYGDEGRGARVITLNAEDLTTYDTAVVEYLDFYKDDAAKLSFFKAYGSEYDFFEKVAAFFEGIWLSFIGLFGSC